VTGRAVFLAAIIVLSTQLRAQSPETKIDALLRTCFENGRFSGSVLVVGGGNVILKKGYGFANQEWEIRRNVRPSRRFCS
jgi:CubicO group peptidase (beta-lactamase class C family)